MGFKEKPVVVYFNYFDIQFGFRAYSAFFFFFFLPYSFYGTTKMFFDLSGLRSELHCQMCQIRLHECTRSVPPPPKHTHTRARAHTQ